MAIYVCLHCGESKSDDQDYRLCRHCYDSVCEKCTAPNTLIDDDGAPDADADSGTVECKACAQPPEEQDKAYARAERQYRDLDRGEL